jgi:hypothetical protein
LKRCLALGLLVAAVLCIGGLAAIGAASPSGASHALPMGPAAIGRNPPQVSLTASYSVLGGGSSAEHDYLTYVSNGLTQVVPLSALATSYMVDSGTQWSAQAVLNGSTNSEQWITSQDVSGTISTPLTVTFSYYNQYMVTFNFNVTRGGHGYTGPIVNFTQMGSSMSSPAPASVWVDANTQYSYGSLLPGSSGSERWILASAARARSRHPQPSPSPTTTSSSSPRVTR